MSDYKPLSDARLAELLELEATASPGDWVFGELRGDSVIAPNATPGEYDTDEALKWYGGPLVAESCTRENRRVIVAARNDLRALVREVQTLRKALDESRHYAAALSAQLSRAEHQRDEALVRSRG